VLKGIERHMVVLKNTGSPLYEEAYFILKQGRVMTGRADMIAECNRIIETSLIREGKMSKGKERRWPLLVSFFLGLMLGAGMLWLFSV